MGAGENVVLALLSEIVAAGNGALFVIDEIELGLHVSAQVNLIKALKDICLKKRCQIVCSTHSKYILDSLPPEGRIFVNYNSGGTEIIPEITSEYAFAKLSHDPSNELTVLVEDDVAKTFLQTVLDKKLRERIRLVPVGSDQAVLTHLEFTIRKERET